MSIFPATRPRAGRAAYVSSFVAAALACVRTSAAEPPTPEARYPSAFEGYRSYEANAPLRPWRELNDRAATVGGHGARGGQHAHHPKPEPVLPSSARPANPAHQHGEHRP